MVLNVTHESLCYKTKLGIRDQVYYLLRSLVCLIAELKLLHASHTRYIKTGVVPGLKTMTLWGQALFVNNALPTSPLSKLNVAPRLH